MTTEFNDESSGAGAAQPDPVDDAGVDGGQPEQVSSEAGVDPGAIEDPGPSAEMIRVLAGIEVPENLAEHWDDASAEIFGQADKPPCRNAAPPSKGRPRSSETTEAAVGMSLAFGTHVLGGETFRHSWN